MNKEIRYCLLSETLLACNELTVYEKIVFARISGFETFFEAPEKTAEFLNISTDKVRKAKQKLEKLGFITCVKSSPKGKAYRIKSLNYIEAILSKENNETSNQPTSEEKSHTEPNKGQIEQVIEEPAKEEIREQVIEAYDTWKEYFDTPLSDKLNWFATTRLVKKHGLDKIKKVIKIAYDMQGEKFAPRVSNMIELEAKLKQIVGYAKGSKEEKPKTKVTSTYVFQNYTKEPYYEKVEETEEDRKKNLERLKKIKEEAGWYTKGTK